jgi:hypothetical protein
MKALGIFTGLAFAIGLHAFAASPLKCEPWEAATASNAVSSEREVLQLTYHLLSQADHDYAGHRVRAKRRIRLAGAILGLELQGEGEGAESQADSDASLRRAGSLLNQMRANLPADGQSNMLNHLDNAIKQIGVALELRVQKDKELNEAQDAQRVEPAVVPAKEGNSEGVAPVEQPGQSLPHPPATPGMTPAPVVVQMIKQSTGGFALTWNAVPGQQFQVQYNSISMGNNWLALGNPVTAMDNSVTVPLPATGDSRRLYRIVVLP